KNHALPQDYADMLGWKELARKTDSLFSKLPDHTLVLCDNYGQAGAINYYSKQGIRAVSFNADYINWFDLKRPHNHFIRIKEYEEIENEIEETSPYFNSSILADSITNQYAREYRTRIYVFTGAKVDINKLINQEIEAVKKR
ncbi:MAG TPA: glycosyl transferase, partial [Daejeonella sp.]|nr:glycosyl transferase [Daejeonella sp.]